MKVSIIIPIYNVEENLSECLDSVINQTLKDIEIICINDGSTDNSLAILNSYAQKDNRIVVINKKNEGVSKARNYGLNTAQGEYVMFLDADDYYTLDACEKAYNAVIQNNTDIGVFGFARLNNNKIETSWHSKEITKICKGNYKTDLYSFQEMIWHKIYRKSFLDKYNIRFLTDLKTGEDSVFAYTTFFNNASFTFIDGDFYIYRLGRNNSATVQNLDGVKTNLKSLIAISNIKHFKNLPQDKQFRIINSWNLGTLNIINNKTRKQQKKMYNDIKHYIDFLQTNYQLKDLCSLASFVNLKNIYLRKFRIKWLNFKIYIEKTHVVIKFLKFKLKIRIK